jgi:hypothetical protein
VGGKRTCGERDADDAREHDVLLEVRERGRVRRRDDLCELRDVERHWRPSASGVRSGRGRSAPGTRQFVIAMRKMIRIRLEKVSGGACKRAFRRSTARGAPSPPILTWPESLPAPLQWNAGLSFHRKNAVGYLHTCQRRARADRTHDARVVHNRQCAVRDQPRALPLAPVHEQARAGHNLPIVRPDDRHARRARELHGHRGAEHAREHRARGRARRVDGEEARGQREVRDEVREVAQDEERGEDRRRERARGLRGVVQARELARGISGGHGRGGTTRTRSPAW